MGNISESVKNHNIKKQIITLGECFQEIIKRQFDEILLELLYIANFNSLSTSYNSVHFFFYARDTFYVFL